MKKKDVLIIILTILGIFLISYTWYTFKTVLEVLHYG